MAEHKTQKRKKDSSRGNFALLVIFAVCVIVLAIVFIVSLAQEELKKPKPESTPVVQVVLNELQQLGQDSPDEVAQLSESMNYWPAQEFPSVPLYKASRYRTTVSGMRAEIILPSGESAGLQEYVQLMLDAGAQLRLQTDSLIVIVNAGTEIQIRPTGLKPSIILGAEQKIDWKGEGYQGLVLPTGGKLVSATDTGKTAKLIYRGAAVSDAADYCSTLRKEGFTIERKISIANNTLYARYTKDDLTITVDYFQSSPDYTISIEKAVVAQNEEDAT